MRTWMFFRKLPTLFITVGYSKNMKPQDSWAIRQVAYAAVSCPASGGGVGSPDIANWCCEWWYIWATCPANRRWNVNMMTSWVGIMKWHFYPLSMLLLSSVVQYHLCYPCWTTYDFSKRQPCAALIHSCKNLPHPPTPFPGWSHSRLLPKSFIDSGKIPDMRWWVRGTPHDYADTAYNGFDVSKLSVGTTA